ncbi:DUF5959 family protein [Kitasatospora sp. NPDC058170]|uniref:DUF5959 family protein n=1 Tax=Kitasatospora sp. NPDC058170 TaxID=3346364 RepID=UPI0036DDECF3
MTEVTSESIELIRLGDRQDSGGRTVAVRVGRRPTDRGTIACDITITTEVVAGRFHAELTSGQLDDWEAALDRLTRRSAVRWLDGEHGPELRIEPTGPDGVWVTVSDVESSGVLVRLALTPAAGWVDEQRALLVQVREALPREG